MSSGSPQITKLLKPVKREGVVPSIKSLNAQINAMIQAIGFIEDEDPRMQFLRRVEVCVQTPHLIHLQNTKLYAQGANRSTLFLLGT